MVATSPKSDPAFVTPMAAQPVEKLPEGHDWIYELKLDIEPKPTFSTVSASSTPVPIGACAPLGRAKTK
jgi:hypothetical protein